ncbi:MAG: hypothetical protein M0Z50_07700, partial [Planctomycetia bacterium]|nr:hypothetical protein [Planctomycetia bacterium]
MAGTPEIFDVTIIGGGPVGLYAAYYAGLRQMDAGGLLHPPQQRVHKAAESRAPWPHRIELDRSRER